METIERYSTLLESGRPLERELSTPAIRQSLMDLVATARERERLPLEGAWRLDSDAVRDLEARHDYAPRGGWRGLASLAAGCELLEAHRESFEPQMSPSAIAEWSAEETTRRLVEAFTCRLVPPTTAAGLFILLGIHPAWGVHLAHDSNRRTREDRGRTESRSQREQDLFPEATFQVIREAVFEAITAMTGVLRELDPDRRYPVGALAEWVEAVCRTIRHEAKTDLPDANQHRLPPFVDASELELDGSSWRVIDFTTEDLLDSLLVPAGAARRFDDDTFCVLPNALGDIRVGSFDLEAQHQYLARLIADDPGHRVA